MRPARSWPFTNLASTAPGRLWDRCPETRPAEHLLQPGHRPHTPRVQPSERFLNEKRHDEKVSYKIGTLPGRHLARRGSGADIGFRD